MLRIQYVFKKVSNAQPVKNVGCDIFSMQRGVHKIAASGTVHTAMHLADAKTA